MEDPRPFEAGRIGAVGQAPDGAMDDAVWADVLRAVDDTYSAPL